MACCLHDNRMWSRRVNGILGLRTLAVTLSYRTFDRISVIAWVTMPRMNGEKVSEFPLPGFFRGVDSFDYQHLNFLQSRMNFLRGWLNAIFAHFEWALAKPTKWNGMTRRPITILGHLRRCVWICLWLSPFDHKPKRTELCICTIQWLFEKKRKFFEKVLFLRWRKWDAFHGFWNRPAFAFTIAKTYEILFSTKFNEDKIGKNKNKQLQAKSRYL